MHVRLCEIHKNIHKACGFCRFVPGKRLKDLECSIPFQLDVSARERGCEDGGCHWPGGSKWREQGQ